MKINLMSKRMIKDCGLKKRFRMAKHTSYSYLLTGCDYFSCHKGYGRYWLDDTCNMENYHFLINYDGKAESDYADCINIGLRPYFKYSDIKNNIRIIKENKRYIEALYGMYPNIPADSELSSLLKYYVDNNLCIKTGRVYTYNNDNSISFVKNYELDKYEEYSIFGIRFIKMPLSCLLGKGNVSLPDGNKYERNKDILIISTPVRMIIDKYYDVAFTKDIILSGIPSSFKESSNILKDYLNNYLANEIHTDKVPSNNTNFAINKIKEKLKGNMNGIKY